MKTYDVLFLIEHVDRELDAISCISSILQTTYGLSCAVRNFYSDMVPLQQIKPKVLCVPFFYFLDHAPMRNYVKRWPHSAIVNFAWEQILYKMNMDIKIPKDEWALQRVTHMCWTTAYQDLITSLGVSRDRAPLCGNPVMKFYEQPYRNYFRSRDELAELHGIDPRRRWLLFPENYRWGFLSDRQIEGFAKQGGSLDYIRKAHAYCKRSFAEVLRWFARLDRADDPIIVLRPRPATAAAEITAFAEATLGRIPDNLRVIKAETARDWILASDIVMSSYSTTLIEAALAGKPIHLVAPEPFPEALEDSWYDLVDAITEGDRFVATARDAPAPANSVALQTWARERFLGAGDPLRAMAGVVAQHAGAAPLPVRKDIPRPSAAGALQSSLWNMLVRKPNIHRLVKRIEPDFSFTYHKHEKDVFHVNDVYRRALQWNQILNCAEK